MRKFDRRLVLFLSLCYMLSFLDRSSALLPPPPLSAPRRSMFCITRPVTLLRRVPH